MLIEGNNSLTARIRRLFLDTGLPGVIGGAEAFDSGMEELKEGLLVVAADLRNAERQGVDLADAVVDLARFPHAARMHGVFVDLIEMNVPAELEEWAWRIARAGPLPDVHDIYHA